MVNMVICNSSQFCPKMERKAEQRLCLKYSNLKMEWKWSNSVVMCGIHTEQRGHKINKDNMTYMCSNLQSKWPGNWEFILFDIICQIYHMKVFFETIPLSHIFQKF